jgi:hypothetical protein
MLLIPFYIIFRSFTIYFFIFYGMTHLFVERIFIYGINKKNKDKYIKYNKQYKNHDFFVIIY